MASLPDEEKLIINGLEAGNLSPENALNFDGKFEQSHFTDPEYNLLCAEAVKDAMLGFFITHRKKPIINVIDAGAGAADFLAAVKDILDGDETESFLEANGIKKHQIRLTAIDVDPTKVAEGKTRRAIKETRGMQIDYREADIMTLHEINEIDLNAPTFIIQRSVTQYFTDPGFDPLDHDTWPANGFSDAQVQLINYYAHKLHSNHLNPGSELAIIESTGDEKYARQFAYILAKITQKDGVDYKRDWFLTNGEFGGLIETVNKMNRGRKNGTKRLPAVLDPILVKEIAPGTGARDIEDLYKRYGNGHSLEEFRIKVLEAYQMARMITMGETPQITETEGGKNLVIRPKYVLHLIGLNGRR